MWSHYLCVLFSRFLICTDKLLFLLYIIFKMLPWEFRDKFLWIICMQYRTHCNSIHHFQTSWLQVHVENHNPKHSYMRINSVLVKSIDLRGSHVNLTPVEIHVTLAVNFTEIQKILQSFPWFALSSSSMYLFLSTRDIWTIYSNIRAKYLTCLPPYPMLKSSREPGWCSNGLGFRPGSSRFKSHWAPWKGSKIIK